MILADSNVWIALAIPPHVFHSPAADWLGRVARSERIHFCRATQQSFLRLVTTDAVINPYGVAALTNDAAWKAFDRFFEDDRIAWAQEPSLEAKWKELTAGERATPKLWMDAYLAAFAIEGRYRFVTFDKGFKQFPGLSCTILS